MSLEFTGLDTRTALEKLKTAIAKELQAYEEETWKEQSCLSSLGRPASWRLDPRASFHWTSGVAIVIAILLLLFSAIVHWDPSLILESSILLAYLVFNTYLSGWDCKLQHREMADRTRVLLKELDEITSGDIGWKAEDYIPLFCPQTNSIMLQWTYRDGQLVNLPWTLLVTDDIIMMRPGKVAPTHIRIFSDDSDLELHAGEVYHPIVPEPSSEPTARQPLQPAKFHVMDTPFIPHIRSCLEGARKKPLSSFENKRIDCLSMIERWLTPSALVLSFTINVIRYFVLESDMGHWATLFFAIPVHTVLPFLPISLPLMWIALNHYGCGRIITLFHKSKRLKIDTSEREFEDSDGGTPILDEQLPWLPIWQSFKTSFLGSSPHLPRTGNILQGLGSVTSLCCVDKRGILSTPDPTPEKVFFMSSLSDDDTDSVSSGGSVFGSDEAVMGEKGQRGGLSKQRGHNLDKEDYYPEHHPEVLTLSQNSASLVGVEFDETNWERHISSLKPMGLTILMNTCNPNTVETFSTFMDHIYTSVNGEDCKHFTHVSQRRCLCQLAQVMGFTKQATEAYELRQKLALYKLPSDGDDEAGGRRLARSRSFIKKRIPAPHSLSVLVKQSAAGTAQLLTQGTADLLIDLCTEFWDGIDLYSLTDNERKKILDFYQRATLSSYCTSFAYQPMAESIDSRLGDQYIELPGNQKEPPSQPSAEIPGLVRSSWDVDTSREGSISEVKRTRKYHSLDSAMNKLGSIRNAEECYRSQCGQIFIGMVTSNYQAKPDIVSLIEQLDNACIRFVHFSRDQELRSRVFSEKMGLEAGWNCHISLLQQDGTVPPSSTSSSHTAHHGNAPVSRQYSSHSSSCHDNTITDGEMSNRLSDNGEILVSSKTDGPELSPRSSEEMQVTIDVEPQRVHFEDRVEAIELEMEELTPKDKASPERDAVAEQPGKAGKMSSEGDGGEEKDEAIVMRTSSAQQLNRPCSRDADTEDANEDEDEDEDDDDDEAVHRLLLKPKGASSSHKEKPNQSQERQVQNSEDAMSADDAAKSRKAIESRRESGGSQRLMSDVSSSSLPGSQRVSRSTSPTSPAPNGNNSEDAKESDALLGRSLSGSAVDQVDLSNRRRQISETQTFNSDVSVAETDTLSHLTESETAGGFDISNRAKLPRGISNIRPHLENIDNVPLLVPLFTDVTPETTREMIQIMQEYGEVVCCLGSSLNLTNAPIFAQADISIGLEPFPPHVCMSNEEAMSKPTPNWTASAQVQSPMEVTSLLTSLPCSLSFHRSDNISLVAIIKEARGICNSMVNCFNFMLLGLLAVSGVQLLSTLLFLPPPLSGRHVLWLAAVVLPLLASSLMGSNCQSKVMTQATGKNLREKNTDHVLMFGFSFVFKFLGSVVICVLCHALTLYAFCQESTPLPGGCHFILFNRNSTSEWNGLGEEFSSHLVLAQNIQTFILILFLVSSSASFVYCLKPVWRKPPFRNRFWCSVIVAILIMEIIYFVVDVRIWGSPNFGEMTVGLGAIPLSVWLLAFLWPLAAIFFCEAIKQYEIQVFVRWQKRTRLQFGTKLGMNSPF
ncbi:transmembrane protein 94-like [Diadema antillarum]|uniref:transmembrane protein 94-like n=1 Tax=Diadema antillarum TaxID=105358 RepID=UPI003A86A56E